MLTLNQILQESYVILQEIGKGGTGTVYLAYHRRLEKYVVLKRIHNLNANVDWRKEVDILKNLHHPNLPQVFDFLQDQDAIYTVMDYVEGRSLSSYIEEGYPFTEQNVCYWLSQLANVLQYLHGQEPPILHCDIKPENIIITPRGDAVLIDFNMSMAVNYDKLMGISPAFASPEQMEMAARISYGQTPQFELDGRTDIYSLAASFYPVLCGRMPSALMQVTPLREQDLGYSEGLTQLLDRAMSRDREQRPPTAKRFLAAVNKLKRQNRRYAAILALRALSILLSGILIAGGIYCLIAAARTAVAERFSADIVQVFNRADVGDTARAEELCRDLLNEPDYRQVLNDQPGEHAKLLALLGDVDFAEERYASASDFYQRAAETTPAGEKSGYWTNAIISLAESGNTDLAQRLRETVESELSDGDRQFVSAILYARQGRGEECLAAVESLLQTETDRDICARAAVAAASVARDASEEIQWLERASLYGGGRNVTRALASAYVKLSQSTAGSGSWQALGKAVDLYKSLAGETFATRADRLNYAIVLRMAGQSAQSADYLRSIRSEYPGDYRLLAQLAFSCYESGDLDGARKNCTAALDAWERDLSPDKESRDSENICNLMALKERLGV